MPCILVTSLISTTAFAITQSQPFKTPTINDHNYSFTSEVWDRHFNPATVEAVAFIKADTNVPSGYMGGQARLYNTSGNIKASSSWTYSPSSLATFYVYSPRVSIVGQYYAQNQAEFYNGNGYTRYTGYKSPIQALSSSKLISTTETQTPKAINDLMLQKKYAVNSKGETYGSALSEYTIGVEPDLISAIGTNGVKGYIKADDLTPKISSIEEALAQNGKNGDIHTIPVYDVDGTTVLCEFELVTNYELGTEAD